MEEFQRIYSYLPISSQDDDEPEYIRTLFRAFEMSYTAGLYQFAYIQLHMIFMVCIYYMLLKISTHEPEKLKDALHFMLKNKDRLRDFYGPSNTRSGNLYFGSFAALGESDIFLLFKIVGMDSNLQGELQKLVEERNKYAHANGNIIITSQETIDEKISLYIRLLERVFALMRPLIQKLYIDTILSPEFYDPEIRAFVGDEEQMNEAFIRRHCLTQRELNVCRRFDVNSLAGQAGYDNIKQLHIALNTVYRGLAEQEE